MTPADGLRLHAASLSRGGQKILKQASIHVPPGQLTFLVGPNGAGKSTALQLLAGDLAPDTGEALLDGRPLSSLGPGQQALRRAVMTQEHTVPFRYAVGEIVSLGTMPANLPAHRAQALIAEALRETDTAHLAARDVTTLSGGERQRVQLARALVQLKASPEHPGASRHLLLDEPTASLDLRHQLAVMEMALALARAGFGVVCVVHDLTLAGMYADALYVLKDGGVVAQGKPEAVITRDLVWAVYGVEARVDPGPRLVLTRSDGKG